MEFISGHRVKFDWALQNLEKLREEVTQFLSDNRCSLVQDSMPQRNNNYTCIIRIEEMQELPRTFSAQIGSILHGFRSSLDHLAYALAVSNVGIDGDLDGIQFPIFKHKDRFLEINNNGKPKRGSGLYQIRSMKPRVQMCIRSLQPYHRNRNHIKHPLWIVHKLSNIDKHRQLHMVEYPIGSLDFTSSAEEGIQFNWRRIRRYRPLRDGAEILRLNITTPDGHDGRLLIVQSIPPDIAFDEQGIVKDRYAIETLASISTYIQDTVFPKLEKHLKVPILCPGNS